MEQTGTLTGHILRLQNGRVLWTDNPHGIYSVTLKDGIVRCGNTKIAKVVPHTWDHTAYLLAWVDPVSPLQIRGYGFYARKDPDDEPTLLPVVVAEAGAPSFVEAKASLIASLPKFYSRILHFAQR